MSQNSVARRNEILKMLMKEEDIKTSTLANHFGVTTETVRKDLLFLQETGVIQKLHGRARVLRTSSDTPIDIRTHQMQSEKILIAKRAVEMVENGSIIYIDGGSTNLEIAKMLSSKEGVVVITTSLSAANIVARQNNQVYIASGFVEAGSMIISGPFLFDSIKQFKPVISFMGTNGVLYHDGPTTKNYNDIEAKKAIISNSSKSVVVCDSSKFLESAMLKYADWDDIDYLITDPGIPKQSFETISVHTTIIIAELSE